MGRIPSARLPGEPPARTRGPRVLPKEDATFGLCGRTLFAHTPAMSRVDGRFPDQLRSISFEPGYAPYATGSVLVSFGETRVLCTAMVENKVPLWMKQQNVPGGWLTAEYAMLPSSTLTRKQRDSTRGKIDGRSTEIQRLIGRALRAGIDLKRMGQRTMWVDCDVLQADGGTRTAAITGAAVAVALAGQRMVEEGMVDASPAHSLVAAVSVGVVHGELVLDLNYREDKDAAVDMNVVMTDTLDFVEMQGAGEEATFSRSELESLLDLAKSGIEQLVRRQKAVLEAI